MMYNMTTSSTHQLHVPLCSPSSCQMHAPRYPTNMHLIIHHKIYQWSSNKYQPCTLNDLPQRSFTTTNTKHPKLYVLEVCLNISMTSLDSIITIYLITKVSKLHCHNQHCSSTKKCLNPYSSVSTMHPR
jgi:hypothetical protein